MNRPGRVAALLIAVLLGLIVAGWGPVSGNEPEPSPTALTTLDVRPSDGLPVSSTVTVIGVGFFPDVSIPDTTVSVSQCVISLSACGSPEDFSAPSGSFRGEFGVVRFLSLLETTVDCAEVECDVLAEGTGASARHHLTFSTALPTTTTIPPRTTTTVTTTPGPTTTVDLAPRPGVTIPPTTRPGTKSTSTSTTRPRNTPTSAPATTTTSVPSPFGGDPPTLVAVTTKNEPAGPPGGGLRVQGSGYTCETVYFFFDGTRVGSDAPDEAGDVSKGGLSVPGDAGRGSRQVTSSCDPSGDTVAQASVFEVLPVSVHRPAFVTSLPLPSQIALSPRQLLASAAIATAAIMLIAFPYELFNSTMEENYDEVRAWFGLPPRGVEEVKTRSRTLSFFVLTAVSAVACGFLSPEFGLNMTSLVMFVGMFVALLVMAVAFSIPADIGIRRQYGEWGKLNFLPGSVIVSIVLVLASRLLDFQPGYFYGALAGLAFRSALSEGVQGKMTAANWIFSLFVSVGAFFLRVPVSAAAAEPGSSVWWIGLEVCLALIFLWGVEGLAVAMLPMKFLDGRKVFRWNRAAWAALFFLGIFATVHVLLRPGSGYVGETSGEISIGVMVLFALFGLGSIAFWAYFRFRPERWAPVKL